MIEHETNQWRALQRTVAFLRKPESYPEKPVAVEAIETHFSWVFLTGRYAYKLKKPVRFLALDYTCVEARRQSVLREAALNRRLAPGIYLGAVPLTWISGGDPAAGHDRLRLGEVGERPEETCVADWLLKMKRLPREAMLDRAIGKNSVYQRRLARAAQMLTEFYQTAERIPMPPGQYRELLAKRIGQNFQALSPPRYRLDGGDPSAVRGALLDCLERNTGLFERRAEEVGLVDGHGDLRPEHICLASPPVIIDRLEVDSLERAVDPVDELAFLYMECELLGHPEAGQVFFDVYRRLSGDAYPPQLALFHRSLRAMTRAKFSAWHLDDPRVTDKSRWRKKTVAYLNLANVIQAI